MSQEFSKMLKDTLDNMKNKIKQANEKWDNENEQ
jgi:gas vesicle protein